MNPRIEQLKREIARPASRILVGGFRPPDDPLASWYGRVSWVGRDEQWPLHEGKPMWPLLQVNLTAVPYVPPALAECEFLSVFVGTNELFANENGDGWCIRTYRSTNELVQVDAPQHGSTIRPFPVGFELIEADMSEHDSFLLEDLGLTKDEAVNFDEHFGDYYELVGGPAPGSKLGGWPSTLQHGVYCVGESSVPPSTDEHEFVMQFDAEPKANWFWPGSGCAYVGVNKQGRWTIQVQMW